MSLLLSHMGQEGHTCTETEFFFPLYAFLFVLYFFSAEHVLVLWTAKGLFLIFSVKPSPTPAASKSIHLPHSVSILCLGHYCLHHSGLKLALYFFLFFPLDASTSRAVTWPAHSYPQHLTPCLAQGRPGGVICGITLVRRRVQDEDRLHLRRRETLTLTFQEYLLGI